MGTELTPAAGCFCSSVGFYLFLVQAPVLDMTVSKASATFFFRDDCAQSVSRPKLLELPVVNETVVGIDGERSVEKRALLSLSKCFNKADRHYVQENGAMITKANRA